MRTRREQPLLAAGERTSDWRAVVTACPGVPWQAVGPQASSLDPTVETFLLLLDHVTVLATSTVSLQHLVLPIRWQLGQSSRLDWLHVFRWMLKELHFLRVSQYFWTLTISVRMLECACILYGCWCS